jgi:uncharacterized protein YcaQ
LLPLNLYPLMRWRMARADRGEIGWKSMRAFATERRPEADAVLKRIGEEGALAASDFVDGKGKGGWWAWSDAKQALEWLFWSGHITTSTRRRNFERLYDLTERVIPKAVLNEPAPAEADAHRLLLGRAAKSLGVATARELRDYFRLKPEPSQTAIAQLVEDGVLRPVQVDGWSQAAYLHPARSKRALFLPRSIHWFGNAPGQSGCSASATGSRFTLRPPSECMDITFSRFCSTARWSLGWISNRIAKTLS